MLTARHDDDDDDTKRDSFCTTKQKNNVRKALTLRVLMIFSESTIDVEIKFISKTLCNKGFPFNVLKTVITKKITVFNKIKKASVQKYPVYLNLTWMGEISAGFAKQIVQRCYFSANVLETFLGLVWFICLMAYQSS